jgi:hypothetical protein
MNRRSFLPHVQAARLDSFGLVPLRRGDDWSVTMKWSNRIVQGFNPEYDVARRALKVAIEARVFRLFARRSPDHAQTSGATFRARFVPSHRGLKPWAVLLDHFMVNTCRHSTNAFDTTT